MTTKSMESRFDKGWMKISRVLMKGFLDIHHEIVKPIDVIEKVQKIYNQELKARDKKAYKRGYRAREMYEDKNS